MWPTGPEAGFTHVLLLGMGGSSLGPEVLKMTFGKIDGFPELHVLDSTDPAQVKAFENKVDLAKHARSSSRASPARRSSRTSSSSTSSTGSSRLVGAKEAGSRFIAITDPGSKMQQVAERDGFRRVFFGWPNIGGRYSVLSDFGLVPAAIMGVDVAKFLDRTEEMVCACMPSVPVAGKPWCPPRHDPRRGREPVRPRQGDDRLVAGHPRSWRLAGTAGGRVDGQGRQGADPHRSRNARRTRHLRPRPHLRLSETAVGAGCGAGPSVEALERAGHPVVRIALDDPYDLGEEFFRWEFATAVAGSILGINPFDQPDVEASKIATRKLTDAYEKNGALPAETPIFTSDGITLFTTRRMRPTLAKMLNGTSHAGGISRGASEPAAAGRLLCAPGLHRDERGARKGAAGDAPRRTRCARTIATCLEFGPRFLHSTGQAYKGGPNTGVFLQITCDDAFDLPVPDQKYTFGVVKAAQARGDFEVLVERKRRALRAHLGADVAAHLGTLHAAFVSALRSRATSSPDLASLRRT